MSLNASLKKYRIITDISSAFNITLIWQAVVNPPIKLQRVRVWYELLQNVWYQTAILKATLYIHLFFSLIHCDKQHSSCVNGLNGLCGMVASCLGRMLCGVQVRESQETRDKVNWSPWYILNSALKMASNAFILCIFNLYFTFTNSLPFI